MYCWKFRVRATWKCIDYFLPGICVDMATPAPAAAPEAAAPAPVDAGNPAAEPPAPAVESKAITTGAPAPAAVTKVEEAPTEPGTIIHMEKATQKIEHELLYKRVETWEESAKAKIDNRFNREEKRITEEEATMKTKAEARLRKKEEKLENLRAKYTEMMKNEIAAAHKAAEEKRAVNAAKKGEDILKTQEMAAKIRATGKFPVKYGCFAA